MEDLSLSIPSSTRVNQGNVCHLDIQNPASLLVQRLPLITLLHIPNLQLQQFQCRQAVPNNQPSSSRLRGKVSVPPHQGWKASPSSQNGSQFLKVWLFFDSSPNQTKTCLEAISLVWPFVNREQALRAINPFNYQQFSTVRLSMM